MTRGRPTTAQLADQCALEWLQERHDAETEPCPTCRARPGQTCLNVHTGRPLAWQPAHLNRIRRRTQTSQATASIPTAA